jgi:hypothetical protein
MRQVVAAVPVLQHLVSVVQVDLLTLVAKVEADQAITQVHQWLQLGRVVVVRQLQQNPVRQVPPV